MLRLSKWVKGAATIFLASALVLTGCGGAKETSKDQTSQASQTPTEFKPLPTNSNKVVAEYKGGKVTEGELNRYINIVAFLDPQLEMMMGSMKDQQKQIKTELSKEVAARKYMAERVKEDPSYKEKTDQTMKEFENSFKNQPAQQQSGQKQPKSLDEAIKGKGFTKAELQDFFFNFHKMDAYYNEQLKDEKYDWVKVQHILVSVNDGQAGQQQGQKQPKRTDAEAKKRAEEVKQKLEDGGDFAKLAKEYSDDPGSKNSAGIIEGAADQFVPEFAKASKELPLNKISDPIKTSYGYHVLKVLDRKQEPLAKADEQVKQPKKQEIYESVVKEIGFKSLLT
ncbi:peptidylprolyl isomerase [Laceyella putida]|uniref:Peptidylprolyl isomerase n=1 Tax=Laceyella putida TaxID=110101 RepID=A0ABW2RRH5_9BACL